MLIVLSVINEMIDSVIMIEVTVNKKNQGKREEFRETAQLGMGGFSTMGCTAELR